MFHTQQKVALASIPKAQPHQMAAQVGFFLGLKTSLSVSGKTISLTPHWVPVQSQPSAQSHSTERYGQQNL